MDYESLLKRAKKDLPEDVVDSERFQIPKVRGHIQGNRTILSNFMQIASTLHRNPELMLKYVEKELAAKAEIKNNFVIFNSKQSSSKINDKVVQFTDEFVICKTCGKPDTQLKKEAGIFFIRCSACGSNYSINSKF